MTDAERIANEHIEAGYEEFRRLVVDAFVILNSPEIDNEIKKEWMRQAGFALYGVETE